MAMPGKKFADVVVARLTKRPAATPAPADDDEAGGAPALGGGDAEPADTDADAAANADDAEAAEQGKVLRMAIDGKNDVAIREAVKAIVHECLEEYGPPGK